MGTPLEGPQDFAIYHTAIINLLNVPESVEIV